MSAQALHNGSHILLAAGIVLLILTVVLAVKFEIFRMLKNEFEEKKNTSGQDRAEPHIRPAAQPQKTEDNIPSPSAEAKKEDVPKEVPNAGEIVHSATMVVSSRPSIPDSDGTVVVSNKKNNITQKDDYVMIENILVIHGDPDIIKL